MENSSSDTRTETSSDVITDIFVNTFEDLQKEFSNFKVTMGIDKYDHQENPTWWIEVKSPEDPEPCTCCGQVKVRHQSFSTYANKTFNEAYTKIKQLIGDQTNEPNGLGTAEHAEP